MRCKFCKKESDQAILLEGIYDSEMIICCAECAEKEGVPLIRKPSTEQLNKAEERYSVRERMEYMSGMRDKTEISGEQLKIQGDIARLKMPEKKQYHEDVLENYYWTLNMARRRKKLSIKQLANLTQIDKHIIEEIERGKIPKDFEEIFLKLESFLGIKLLKSHKPKVKFRRTIEEEREILKKVREKMENPQDEEDEEDEETIEQKKEKLERISRGEIDFSNPEDIENVTLSDLVEMKRQRERKEIQRKKRIQTDAMLGDDLELDIDVDEI
ncbi:MAG: helix-turn-helix domain-containing protein [archaeon]